MLIVAGSFEFEPSDRDEFLTQRTPAMVATRQEPGCLEYVMSADPVDPARVILFERWADHAAFDAHMVGVQSAPRPSGGPAMKGMSVEIYDIEGVRAFG
jgi:quinol monooxygenase YgiN